MRSLFTDKVPDEVTDEGKARATKPASAIIADNTMTITKRGGGKQPLRFAVELVAIAGAG